MASARRPGTYNDKVFIDERGRELDGMSLSDTCANFGCMPKNAMFNTAAHQERLICRNKDYNTNTTSRDLAFGDFFRTNMKAKRDAYLKRLNDIYERNLGNAQADYVQDIAKLVAKDDVQVVFKASTW